MYAILARMCGMSTQIYLFMCMHIFMQFDAYMTVGAYVQVCVYCICVCDEVHMLVYALCGFIS